MLVRNYTHFAKLASIETLGFTEYDRSEEVIRVAGPICGTYAMIGPRFVAIYRSKGVLLLRIDDAEVRFDSVRVGRTVTPSGIRISVTSDDVPVLDEKYVAGHNTVVPNDPTFVEEEDCDFGLYLYNLSKDSDRQKRVFCEGAG